MKNELPTNDPAGLAKQRLAEACQTIDKSARLNWIYYVGGVVLVAVFALALADYFLMWPAIWRTSGALALGIVVCLGLVRLVNFFRRPTLLKPGALKLEAERPELGCEISTAAEYLTGERSTRHEYEPELVEALEKKAAQKLANPAVDYDQMLLRRLGILGGVFLLLLISILLIPGALVAFQHAAVPFSKARYTRVEVTPGNVEIPVGRGLTFSNRFSGRFPKDPRFHWQSGEDGKWQSATLKEPAGNTFTFCLTNLKSDLVYRVTGNDAVSEQYCVTTYVPPEIKDFKVDIAYPAYTRLTASSQKSRDIAVVRASVARISVQPSVELAKASLRFSARPEQPLTKGNDGWWTASLAITNDTDYWVELSDQKGHRGGNVDPDHIKALPDKPPHVEITEPGKDTRAAATNRVLVKISVSDDFGVAGVKLVFNKLSGPQHEIPAAKVSEHNGEVTATAELDLSTLGLKEYELVAYHAEAADNNTLDGPGVGRSPVYFVEITNQEGGGKCLAQGQGQKVNLLVVQKQIIADTTAVSPTAPPEKLRDLAARQNDAADFGRLYLDTLNASSGAEAAAKEMQAAVDDMQSARTNLDKLSRAGALPPEEGALAHLYQVLKLMPELENLPTVPKMEGEKPPPDPKVQVVLEAIKQKKKEQPDNQDVEAALEKAQELARSQAGLNSAMQRAMELASAAQPGKANPNNAQPGQNPGQNAGQGEGEAPVPGSGQGKPTQAKQDQTTDKEAAKPSKNDSPAGEKGQGPPQPDSNKPGEGAGKGEAAGKPEDSPQISQNPVEMARQEAQLSKESTALADKLKRLAGKDGRLGHNLGSNAERAAAKMTAAAQAITAGNGGMAGEQGLQGELALRSIIAQLERVLKNQPEPSDIAAEDFPKEYEGLISEYLKRLSHAE